MDLYTLAILDDKLVIIVIDVDKEFRLICDIRRDQLKHVDQYAFPSVAGIEIVRMAVPTVLNVEIVVAGVLMPCKDNFYKIIESIQLPSDLCPAIQAEIGSLGMNELAKGFCSLFFVLLIRKTNFQINRITSTHNSSP